mmetsp:Transcript_22395/g.42242  ORF Transcript_22395/g.42242 Transcript_22395/m.42242 type:complete len:201 (+) Transcript_22395:58-660(+)
MAVVLRLLCGLAVLRSCAGKRRNGEPGENKWVYEDEAGEPVPKPGVTCEYAEAVWCPSGWQNPGATYQKHQGDGKVFCCKESDEVSKKEPLPPPPVMSKDIPSEEDIPVEENQVADEPKLAPMKSKEQEAPIEEHVAAEETENTESAEQAVISEAEFKKDCKSSYEVSKFKRYNKPVTQCRDSVEKAWAENKCCEYLGLM